MTESFDRNVLTETFWAKVFFLEPCFESGGGLLGWMGLGWLLGCWAAGLLGCWAAGLLGCWAAGLLGCWAAGLGCWAAGLGCVSNPETEIGLFENEMEVGLFENGKLRLGWAAGLLGC